MSSKTIKIFGLIFGIAVFILIGVINLESALCRHIGPKQVGEFETDGAKTKIYLSGECQIFVTKWASNPNPNFYFSCKNSR